MEEARRRLAILRSHLRSVSGSGPSTFHEAPNPSILASNCASSFSDADKESEHKDCVFCKIIRAQAPTFKLYEDDICLCILDINPLTHGHALIIPKCHFSSLDATPPSVIGAMCSKVPLISNAVMKATGCDSFNLLVNNGAAAGQVIYHTHIHIIPRKACDCLWASESLQRHPLKLDLETSRLAHRIRERLSFGRSFEDNKGQASTINEKLE